MRTWVFVVLVAAGTGVSGVAFAQQRIVVLPPTGASQPVAADAEAQLREFLTSQRHFLVEARALVDAAAARGGARTIPEGEALVTALEDLRANAAVGLRFAERPDGVVVITLQRTDTGRRTETTWIVGVRPTTTPVPTGVRSLLCHLRTGGACGLSGPPVRAERSVGAPAPAPTQPAATAAPAPAAAAPPASRVKVAVLPPAIRRVRGETAEMLRGRVSEAADDLQIARVPDDRVDEIVFRLLRLRDTSDLGQQLRAATALEATHVLVVVLGRSGDDLSVRVDLVEASSGTRRTLEGIFSADDVVPRTGALAEELLVPLAPRRTEAPPPAAAALAPVPVPGGPSPAAGGAIAPPGESPMRVTERGAQVDALSGQVQVTERVVETGVGGGIDRRETERGVQADLGQGTFGVGERVVEQGEGVYREQNVGLAGGSEGVSLEASGVERTRVPLRDSPIGFNVAAVAIYGTFGDYVIAGGGAQAGVTALFADFPERSGSAFGLALRANGGYTYIAVIDVAEAGAGTLAATASLFYWSMTEKPDLSVSGWGLSAGVALNYLISEDAPSDEPSFGPTFGLDFPKVNPGSTSYTSWRLAGIILPIDDIFLAIIAFGAEFM